MYIFELGQIWYIQAYIQFLAYIFIYTVSYYCPIGLLLEFCKESFERKLCHPLFGMFAPSSLRACAAQSTSTSPLRLLLLLLLLLPLYRLTQFLDTYFYIVEFSYRFGSFFTAENSFRFFRLSILFCHIPMVSSFQRPFHSSKAFCKSLGIYTYICIYSYISMQFIHIGGVALLVFWGLVMPACSYQNVPTCY